MPRRRSPLDLLFARFKKRRTIARPIASDTWTYTDAEGRKHVATLLIGRPQRVPGDKQRAWFCTVYVDGWTPHVMPAIGVGPLDALMNALTVVRSFREHVAGLHIVEKPMSSTRRR